MGRSAEAFQAMEDANEQQRDSEMEEMYAEYVAVRLNSSDDLFNMMVGLNAARMEEIERDMPEHKRGGYTERLMEIADMQRKAKRENGE